MNNNLASLVQAMPAEQRKGAIAVLDYLTRPLSQREIMAHLRHGGVSQARAAKIAAVVKHLHIVALVGDGEL